MKKLQQKMQALVTELKTLLAKDDFSAEDETKANELDTQIAAVKADIDREVKRKNMQANAEANDAFLNDADPAETLEPAAEGDAPSGQAGKSAVVTSPALPRSGKVKYFKGANADQQAYDFGMWFMADVMGQSGAKTYCKKKGIQLKVSQNEGINGDGGATVPVQFANTIIDLRAEYGVFRGEVMAEPMSSDNMVVPRAKGGLRAYPVGEGQEGTKSKTAWDQVELTARKWMVLAKYSSEVNEDSIVNWADRLAYEIGYAFAQSEDEAGFIGDGTSTYHRITGIVPKLQGLSGTVANVAGLVVASGNAWGEITLADFSKLKGRLPGFAYKRNNVKWYCSNTFYAEVMEKLILAAGGNSAAEIVNGANQFRFMGYPVIPVEALPQFEANSQIPVVFGDLNQGVALGDRRGITLATSEHSAFSSDEIEIRGTERFDINVHDVGNASATASERKAGPVVGLITAAG